MGIIHRKMPLDCCLAKAFNVLDKLLFIRLIFSLKVARECLNSPRRRALADPGTDEYGVPVLCENAVDATTTGALNFLLRGFLKMLDEFSSRDELPLVFNFQMCLKVSTCQCIVKTGSPSSLSCFSKKKG